MLIVEYAISNLDTSTTQHKFLHHIKPTERQFSVRLQCVLRVQELSYTSFYPQKQLPVFLTVISASLVMQTYLCLRHSLHLHILDVLRPHDLFLLLSHLLLLAFFCYMNSILPEKQHTKPLKIKFIHLEIL